MMGGYFYGLDKKTFDLAIFLANKSLAMGCPATPNKIQYLMWEVDGAYFTEYGVRYLSDTWKATVFGPQIDGVRTMYGFWVCDPITRPIEHDDYEPPEPSVRDIAEDVIAYWYDFGQHDMRNIFYDSLPAECFKEVTSQPTDAIRYPLGSVCGI